jgi:hypothetical protein
MIIKDNVKILGGIASKIYLTTDESGVPTGQLTSGGGGGGGGGATLVYNNTAIGKGQENYINNNYYQKPAGTITTGQTSATNGTLPASWTSPFVFNDTDLNKNKKFIVDNINVRVTDISNGTTYDGTIVHGDELFYNAENKIIYNFTVHDFFVSSFILDPEKTYALSILFYYIQPQTIDSFDKYNFNKNTSPGGTGGYTTDNAIIITKGSQVQTVNTEYFNIKLTIEITDTDIPGKFKLFLMNSSGEAEQIFSYPSIYDDNGKSFNITADAFTVSSMDSTLEYSTSTIVTNFPITNANISIISYLNI